MQQLPPAAQYALYTRELTLPRARISAIMLGSELDSEPCNKEKNIT